MSMHARAGGVDARSMYRSFRLDPSVAQRRVTRDVLRRILNPMGTVDAIEFLLDKLRQTKSNSEFFDSMNT